MPVSEVRASHNASFDFEDMQYRDALGNTVAKFVHEQKKEITQIVVEEIDCVKKDYMYNIAVMSESKDDNLTFIWSLTKVTVSFSSREFVCVGGELETNDEYELGYVRSGTRLT